VAVFQVERVRAVTGRLQLRRNNVLTPLENVDLVLIQGTDRVTLSTIHGGDFYIENLTPGHYAGQLKVGGKTCRLELIAPDNSEIVANVGDVVCETID
jgi:hypothetical protein